MSKTKFRTEDIRPQKLLKDSEKSLAQDIKYIQERKRQFKTVGCPACGSKKSILKYRKYLMTYYQCQKCQTVYTNPRPTDAILERFYKQSKFYKYWNDVIFPASEKVRRKNIFKPRVDKILYLCKKYSILTNSLIDVGAGFGTFLVELKSRKKFKHLTGIEPTSDLARTCREKGLSIIEKTIEEIPANTISANVVTAFEVIEHLYSPKDFLLSCNKILKKGGLLVISCPNIQGFDIQVLGTKSDTIDVEHLNYFNPHSLSSLLENCGFSVIEKQTPGLLDADLVRNKILSGTFKTSDPLLKTILIDKWEKVGQSFQEFLQKNLLSSHMVLVARRT